MLQLVAVTPAYLKTVGPLTATIGGRMVPTGSLAARVMMYTDGNFNRKHRRHVSRQRQQSGLLGLGLQNLVD